MTLWTVNKEGDPVLMVQAVIMPAEDGWWHGHILGTPDAPKTSAQNVTSVRLDLASQVWTQVKEGQISVPESLVSAVRVFAYTYFEYPRAGEFSGPPVTVHAQADKGSTDWKVISHSPMEILTARVGAGPTFAAAREELADELMTALEVGVEEIPPEWRSLRLVVVSRKTIPVSTL